MSDKFDREWALDQLAAAQVNLPVGNAVVKLIDAWLASGDTQDEKQQREILDLFSRLVAGQNIAPDDGDWVNAEAGFMLSTGQIVRISPTAFQGNLGRIHNGRIVKVVARRWGDIVCDSVDGKNPELRGAHYPPNVIQVRQK